MAGSIPTTSPSSPALGERDDVGGLESWGDPVPRRSHRTVDELQAAFVAACLAQQSRMPRRPTPEERAKEIDDRQRNVLVTALNKYAKLNNIQPSELEFVQVEEASVVCERMIEFVHYNFLVKRRSGDGGGETTMFFAEVKPECNGEEDVYHCTPLQDTDSGICLACNDGAEDLRHPTAGGYVGGHKDNDSFYRELVLDSDDDVCYI